MPTPLSLNWSAQGGNETDISGGFTQNTGGINVGVTYMDDGLGNQFNVSTDAQYVGSGEPMSGSSAVELRGDAGTGDTSTTTIDFSAASGSGMSSEVENVIFRINDADISTWTDILAVRAYDANGNQIDVSMTYQGNTTTGTDPLVTGTGGNVQANTASGSILVQIAGPVAYFEIDYGNDGTGAQALWVTDIHFDAIDLDGTVEGSSGDDVIDGSYILDPDGDKVDAGDEILPGYGADGDLIEAYGGNDTVLAGAGDDSVYAGTGNDSVSGGAGNDTVFLEGGNDTFGDWSTDNGNDVVYGGTGNDQINGGNGNDTLFGGSGDDTLTGASDDDTMYGGTGSDLFAVTDDHESSLIEGGEDVDGSDLDEVNFSNYLTTQGVTVTATGDEAGGFDFDGTPATGSYSEIEAFNGTDYDDTFDLDADDSGTSVFADEGDDSITTGSGDDVIDGGQGADTFDAGAGDDQIDLGEDSPGVADGDEDVVVLEDGFGNDILTNFDAPTPDVGGTFTGIDTLDVTNLYDLPAGDPDRTPVRTNDVTVSDDGSGNALLTFPNGETLTLVGIDPVDADNPFYLNAIGIPLPDGTVEGTSGDDTIDNSYTGDPDGDMVDAGDAILPGDTNNDDLIFGYGGNDDIFSGSGDDEVYGGSGDDLVQDSAGNSTLDGGIGNDTINSGSGNDTVYGGDGNDVVNASIGSDEIYGGDGNDTMSAGGFAGAGDTMFGGTGEDEITGGAGNDSMYGGTGNDSLSTNAGGGTDIIEGGEDVGNGDVDTLAFNDGNGPEGVDVTMSGDEAGSYSFPTSGGSGTFTEIEQFELTDQDDSFDGVLATGGNTVDGGAGDDVLTGSSGDDSFEGGSGDDTLNANEGDDELSGGAGDDTIFGDEGEDVIVGGADDDALYGGQDNDTIDGGSGDDIVEGGSGDDTLVGGAGADTITGGADQDVIYGGAGDVIDGSESGVDNDTLIVSGVDYIDYDTNPENGIVYFEGGGSLTFSNIENVIVSDRDGTVSGTAGGDLIDAGYTGDPDGDQVDDTDAILVGHEPNDDLIEAGAGNDTISAGAGDDSIYAGTGNDTVIAGSGDDTLFGEAGNDLLSGETGDDTAFGGDGDDIFNGGTGADALYGGNDEDTFVLETGFGSDVIEGGEGGTDNDTLNSTQNINVTVLTNGDEAGTISDGTSSATFSEIEAIQTAGGDDTIDLGGDTAGMTVEAGAGSDVITGGTGDDDLSGDAGDDIFVLENTFGNDTVTGGETGETFGDFLDASATTTSLTLDLSTLAPANPETGTLTDGVSTVTFSEIEYVFLGTGDDSVTGSSGDDQVATNLGADTINLGAGDDQLDLGVSGGGTDGAADVIILQDGSGNDNILNFDGPIVNVDGTLTGIDTFDVTGLNDAQGNPVNTNDVTVTDDGAGNAVLTFPNLESVRLVGISPSDAENPFYLHAIGIPLPDGTVEGTEGNDVINVFYTGDPDGDMVDDNDAILAGDTGNDDLIYGYGGDDQIDTGDGDDEVYGGDGNDFITISEGSNTVFGGDGWDGIVVSDGPGTSTVTGGEDVGDTDFDNIGFDNSNTGQGVTVTLTDDEEGTYSFDGSSASGTFIEIETSSGTDANDTYDLTGDTTGFWVDGNAGDDSILGGAGDDVMLGELGDDTLDGNAGADSLFGGDGDDTITFSEGDSVSGGAGDDLFVLEDLGEPTNGVITIDGGAGDETPDPDGNGPLTGGDTLQLGNLGVLTQNVIDSFVDDGTGSFTGSITLDDGTILNFSEIENIICFTPGTRIATPQGLVAIEDLEVGDLVVTRDHGLQPIRWIEGRTVPAVDRFAPVRIRPNVLAGQDRDLVVSPQHRVLFQGYRAELLFGESEVLVAAKHLIDGMDVTQVESETVTYVHMLFDQHEIIYAEGAATESFHPGDIGFTAVSDAAREELFAIFPELRADPKHYGNTARRCLKSHEAKLIRS